MSTQSVIVGVGILAFLIGMAWAIVVGRRRSGDEGQQLRALYPAGTLMVVGIATAVVGTLLP